MGAEVGSGLVLSGSTSTSTETSLADLSRGTKLTDQLLFMGVGCEGKERKVTVVKDSGRLKVGLKGRSGSRLLSEEMIDRDEYGSGGTRRLVVSAVPHDSSEPAVAEAARRETPGFHWDAGLVKPNRSPMGIPQACSV
jgi:hypothetical protein